MRKILTSESVSEGHPDKVCDQISDAVLDACLKNDPESRVACESLTTTNLIVISGEITSNSKVDYEDIARRTVRDIGYTDHAIGFCADEADVQVHVHQQSADIKQGVDEGAGLFLDQGAGDQGMMFGYASNETPQLMPAPIVFSHRIVERLAELRKTQADRYSFLRPDSKSQISIRYEDDRPVAIETVVVSHQHTEDMKLADLEALVRQVVNEIIPDELLHDEVKYLINPTGRFVVGGPNGDTGLTGRKIIVDTYGGIGRHGGGAFSGKDPSKVDRSAAYFCRYMAKNIVAAELADRCEIQLAYAIGVAKPVSLNICTFDTWKVLPDAELEKKLIKSDIFDMRPAGIIQTLGLKLPFAANWCYQDTAAYGHFGRDGFPWERTDQIDALKQMAGA